MRLSVYELCLAIRALQSIGLVRSWPDSVPAVLLFLIPLPQWLQILQLFNDTLFYVLNFSLLLPV